MEVIELKFLLKLLGFEGYRAPISNLQPNSKTKAPERDRICRNLGDRGYVDYREEIEYFKIESPGKQLLNTDTSQLPITDEELKVLRSCAKETATPGKTKLPSERRQPVIRSLIERGFISAVKIQLKEVWLTKEGKQYLLQEYEDDRSVNMILTTKMLTNYLRFMRQVMGGTVDGTTSTSELSDEDILQTIRNLDRELGTQNYLPIYQLRHKLQPPLSRDDVDNALYRLQRQNKIELSALQDESDYTKEQIDAAIYNEFSGNLFFIMLT
jgi:hypothetical protein